jgi:hypothetical protein
MVYQGEVRWRRQRYTVNRGIVDGSSKDMRAERGKDTRMHMRGKERREHTTVNSN